MRNVDMKLNKAKFAIPGITVVFLVAAVCVGIAQGTVTVSVPSVSGPAGGAFTVPIEVDDATSISGADITLRFDPEVLTATGAQPTSLTSDFFLIDNPMDGQIIVTLAGATGITGGSGSIVNINFDIDATAAEGNTSPLALSSVSLFDESATIIGLTATDGTFAVNAPSPPGEGGGGSACFIATAAYGNPMADEIEILYDFRDRYLLPNKLGRVIVSSYYKYSPKWAKYISDKESLKVLVRIGLTPLIWFSKLVAETHNR